MNRGLRMRFAHTQAPNSVPAGRGEEGEGIDFRYGLQVAPKSVPGGRGKKGILLWSAP